MSINLDAKTFIEPGLPAIDELEGADDIDDQTVNELISIIISKLNEIDLVLSFYDQSNSSTRSSLRFDTEKSYLLYRQFEEFTALQDAILFEKENNILVYIGIEQTTLSKHTIQKMKESPEYQSLEKRL